jgi:uncharacterized protein with HEPN domain
VSCSDRDQLLDVLEAGAAIAEHLQRGPLSDGLDFDAVRVRLIEIGEAVKDVSTELLAQQPSIPWRQVAAMRDQLAHRYFDTSHAIVAQTVGADLVELLAAIESLLAGLDAQRSPRLAGGHRGRTRTGRGPCRDAGGARSKVCKGLPFGLLRGPSGTPSRATGGSRGHCGRPGAGVQ